MSDVLTLSDKVPSATVRQWLVAPGQSVRAGQVLCRAEAEETLVEITASQALTVSRIICPAGQTASAGQPLAELGDGMSNTAEVTSVTPQAGTPSQPAAAGEPGTPPAGASLALMPKAGQTMEEGTIIKWVMAESDTVAKGDILFEVETDKAIIEVDALTTGVLRKILVGDGETVPVKAPVAVIAPADTDIDAFVASLAIGEPVEDTGADTAALAEEAAPATHAAPAAVPATEPTGRVFASPAARRVAKERGIDLAGVTGTGADGRIKAADVEAAAKAPTPAAPAPAAPNVIGEPRPVELTRMRQAIAKNLAWSKQNIPHFYATVTIDASGLRQAHRWLKKAIGSTMNDLVTAAVARTIAEFPEMRCRWEENGVIELPGVNVGIAVGTDDGLRVPVLVNADRLSLAELSRQARAIIEAARQNRMARTEPASFTITNMGMFGVEQFGAIINPPEAAILAVSAVRKEPVVRNGEVVPGEVMSVTLSCDHRIVDGIVATRFLAQLKARLEDIESLLEETCS